MALLPHVLVYISPVLSYLLGTVPCIFPLKYYPPLSLKNPLIRPAISWGGYGVPLNSHERTDRCGEPSRDGHD